MIQSLSACLTNSDTDVCIAACKALAALVADASAREELLKTNALGSLVSILKESSNKEVNLLCFGLELRVLEPS